MSIIKKQKYGMHTTDKTNFAEEYEARYRVQIKTLKIKVFIAFVTFKKIY